MARKLTKRQQQKMRQLPLWGEMPEVDIEARKSRAAEDVALLERLGVENARLQEELSRAKAVGHDELYHEKQRLERGLARQISEVVDRVGSWKAMGLLNGD